MRQMAGGGGGLRDACPGPVPWRTRATMGSLGFRKGEEVIQCKVPGMVWGAGLLPLCPHSQPMPSPSPCREKFLVGLRRTL